MECCTVRVLLAAGAMVLMVMAAVPAENSKPDSSRGSLLVTNKGDHSLSIVDPEKGVKIASVDEGGITGHELAASPDGRRAFVPIYGDSGVGKPGTDGRTMAVIDVAERKLIKTFDFGKPLRPHCAVFGPKNGLLYVTTELTNSITVIDPHTLRIVDSIPTGQPESHMLAISHDGKRGYTANVHAGTVSALDLEAKKTMAVIPVSAQTQRIALSADDHLVFSADQTKPQLAVIDTKSNKLVKWIPLAGLAYGTGATLDGKWLLVTLPSLGQVAVVEISSMKVVRSVEVPKSPQEVLVRPDDQVAYISCAESKKVAAINLKTWKVDHLIETGPGADGMAWASAR
jgi:YVTN family beta-propeller protein